MSNCKICHEPTEDDGYGEPVHAETNRYWHETAVWNDKGRLVSRDGHVATL